MCGSGRTGARVFDAARLRGLVGREIAEVCEGVLGFGTRRSGIPARELGFALGHM